VAAARLRRVPGRGGRPRRFPAPHRRAWLATEGELGGGRGAVERVEAGTVVRNGPFLEFDGRILAGRFLLAPGPGGRCSSRVARRLTRKKRADTLAAA